VKPTKRRGALLALRAVVDRIDSLTVIEELKLSKEI
jgi:hypothetical protein